MPPRFFTSALATIFVACLLLASSPLIAYELSSSAIVNEDGTLRIKGTTVHLHGIYIPKTDRTCKTYRSPPICGTRASVALEFKIDGFVRCDIRDELDDGSVVGWCRVKASKFNEGEDLSAYLLEKGWAVALPDAPFEYQTLEKIAQSRNFGVWGIPVDRVVERP